MSTNSQSDRCGAYKTVAVVGAGGNIGSHLVAHLGRLECVGAALLIDPDWYEERNLASQAITARDVNRLKVEVQAERLREINAKLRVRAIAARIESVPAGLLRGVDVILTGLDSKASRRWVNCLAWRLGIPWWIDAGVHRDGLQARVCVYRPGSGEPCLECGWEEGDYRGLDARMSCLGQEGQGGERTNAPSALGALAAALEMLEAGKILDGRAEQAAVTGREVLVVASTQRQYLTQQVRNRSCRFDHQRWHIEPLMIAEPAECTLTELVSLLGLAPSSSITLDLGAGGRPFVIRLRCCNGHVRQLIRLFDRVEKSELTCRLCGQPMRASGPDLVESLRLDELPAWAMDYSLHELGIKFSDVLTVQQHGADGVSRHYEIVAAAEEGAEEATTGSKDTSQVTAQL